MQTTTVLADTTYDCRLVMRAGEKLWHGGIVTPQLADAYNSIQARSPKNS